MGIYVYAIGWAGAAELPPLAGVLEQPVYRIAADRLAAIGSDCPLAPVRAERRHLAASQRVLQHLIGRFDLLPTAFGTVAGSPDALCRFLAEHCEPLAEQLGRVAGKIEMTLRLSLDAADPIGHLVALTPALQTARDRLFHRGRSPSRDERIRLGRLCDEALRRYREAQSARVMSALAPLCSEIATLPLLGERDIAKLAMLVARNRVGDFEHAVGGAALLLPEDLAVTIGGPWPPHDFVQLAL
jgi:gas vesicle protein GvpL/GvpF